MKKRSIVWLALLAGFVLAAPIIGQVATINGRNLPADTSPASGDILVIYKASPVATRSMTLGALSGFFAPATRTITCTPPLLCDGGASMTLAGDRTLSMSAISLTTDATGSGTTSIPVTISAGAVTLAKMANMATASFLGRNTAGTGAPEVLSNATVSSMLRLPTFDVRAPAYGALCNNSADDQTAIVAAVSAAEATGIGGRIIITGRCRHSGTITVTGSNVHIVGEGPGASQLITTSTTADQIVFSGATASDVSNLTLASSVTRTAGYAIHRSGTIYGDDHDLFIAPTGGNGVFYDGTGGGTKLRDSMIHITGAFDGVTFTGGNDRWLSRLWIQGNHTSGSNCLVFHSTNGADLVENTECVLFGDYGVKIAPGNGESVVWTYFSNVYADQDDLGGWSIAPTGTGTVQGLTCVSCWAGTNGLATATTNGFTISGAGVDGADFYDIRAVNNGGHGVSIDGAAHVSLIGGYITGNSQQTINTKDGITLNNVSGVRIQGVNNVAYGAARHRYSLAINGTSDNLQIIGNDFRGFVTAAVLNTPGLASTRILTENLPHVIGQDSRMLFGTGGFDETNDRLGLLTTTPASTLEIAAAGLTGATKGWRVADLTSGHALRGWVDTSTTSALLGTPGATDLKLETNAVSRLRIDSSGNVVFNESGTTASFRVASDTDANKLFVNGATDFVGIGTATPEMQLHVYGGNTGDTFVGVGPNPDGSPGTESGLVIGYAGLSFGRGVGFLNVRPDSGASGENPSMRFAANNHSAMMITKDGAVRDFSAVAAPAAVADTTACWTADAAAGDANRYCINEAGRIDRMTGLGRVVTTQFDKTSDTALANVTGLTFNVEAGVTYKLSGILYTTANVAGGVKAAVSGTATATYLIYEGDLDNAGTHTVTRATTLGTAVCAVTAATAATCLIRGTIKVNAAGTITLQFAQNASNAAASSVLVGSNFDIKSVN